MVQWSGASAIAAAAALERHVRSLDEKGKRDVSLSHPGVGAAVSVLVPWGLFVFAGGVLVATYHDKTSHIWAMLGSAAALSFAMALFGLVSRRTALAVLGLWSLASLAFGAFLGRYVNTVYMQTYWRVRAAGPGLVGVDPAAAEVASLGDEASVISFVEGTFVDEKRTIGFIAKGTIYCVAPLARRGSPADRAEFWASGTGCCERRANFDCGTSRLSGRLTALSYPTDGDELFGAAVREAASVYNTTVGPRPQRVFFEGDPGLFMDDLRREALAAAALAVGFHLCTCIIISTALQKAGVRWVTLPNGGVATSEDLLMRGGGSSKEKSRERDRTRSPTSMRTILDPLLLRQEEQEERSCLGCGPRRYWTFSLEGAQVEEAEKRIWYSESRRLDQGVDPVFLGKTVIAEDGGFNEIPDLMRNVENYRFFIAATTLGTILYNICYILKLDGSFIGQENAPGSDMWLISESCLVPVFNIFLRAFRMEDIVSFRANVVVPVMELCVLALVLSGALFLGIEGALAEPGSRRRWKNFSRLLFFFPGPLSGFSAMALLHYVNPSVLTEDIFDISQRRAALQPLRVWGRLLCTRTLCFLIGFDAFLMKFRMTSQYINQDKVSLRALLSAGGFLLQLLGVVQVSSLVRARLMRAFFGGEDSAEDIEEKAKEVTYHALLAKEMHRHSSSTLEFMAVALSFSDSDFQSLMLNTPAVRPKSPKKVVTREGAAVVRRAGTGGLKNSLAGSSQGKNGQVVKLLSDFEEVAPGYADSPS